MTFIVMPWLPIASMNSFRHEKHIYPTSSIYFWHIM